MQTSITDIYVLGAGSSAEVKMPVGSALSEMIAASLNFGTDYGMQPGSTKGDDQIRTAIQGLVRKTTNPNKMAEKYDYAINRIVEGAGLADSIDEFMDANRSNDQIQICSKIAIVRAILKEEGKSLLKLDHPNLEINRAHVTPITSKVANTWFHPFFKILKSHCEFDQLPERFRKVLIINFNYDRCIEHYLMCALMRFYGKEQREVKPVLDHLRIYHPYGKIGLLPWQEGKGSTIGFGAPSNANMLEELSKQIQTYGQDMDKGPLIKIHSDIAHAKRIIFLGFRFYRINLDLLFKNVVNHSTKTIIASTCGLSDPVVDHIKKDLMLRLHDGGPGNFNNLMIGTDPGNPRTCKRVFDIFDDRYFFIE